MTESDIDAMVFAAKPIYPDMEDEKLYSSDEFVDFIYRTIGRSFNDSGTLKEKNRRLADAFHLWSRKKLSAHIVKQDFDILYYNNRYVMIEVKRAPSKKVEVWQPYYDDKRNYDIQFKISRALNVPFFTLHHVGGTCRDNTRIGFYYIHNVDANASVSDWIVYDKKIVAANQLITKFEEALNG